METKLHQKLGQIRHELKPSWTKKELKIGSAPQIIMPEYKKGVHDQSWPALNLPILTLPSLIMCLCVFIHMKGNPSTELDACLEGYKRSDMFQLVSHSCHCSLYVYQIMTSLSQLNHYTNSLFLSWGP